MTIDSLYLTLLLIKKSLWSLPVLIIFVSGKTPVRYRP
jgi:hypothetical protein